MFGSIFGSKKYAKIYKEAFIKKDFVEVSKILLDWKEKDVTDSNYLFGQLTYDYIMVADLGYSRAKKL